MARTQTVQLNDGNNMPLVGFGLWKVPQDAAPGQVYNAIKTGYRLFDGAHGLSPRKVRVWPSVININNL